MCGKVLKQMCMVWSLSKKNHDTFSSQGAISVDRRESETIDLGRCYNYKIKKIAKIDIK